MCQHLRGFISGMIPRPIQTSIRSISETLCSPGPSQLRPNNTEPLRATQGRGWRYRKSLWNDPKTDANVAILHSLRQREAHFRTVEQAQNSSQYSGLDTDEGACPWLEWTPLNVNCQGIPSDALKSLYTSPRRFHR